MLGPQGADLIEVVFQKVLVSALVIARLGGGQGAAGVVQLLLELLLLAALVICLLVQNPLLELLAAVTATVGSLTGFILTRLGVRMFDLKSRLTWYIER